MANVQFLRGTNAGLRANNFVPQDGAFYLTTDTNRLYTGVNKGTAQAPNIELIELNKSIHVVPSWTINGTRTLPDNSNLFEIGQFAFVEDDNILCVYKQVDPDNKKWIQVNPDTNTELFTPNNDDANFYTLFTVGNVNTTAADSNNNTPRKMSSVITGTVKDTNNHILSDNITLEVAGDLELVRNNKKLTIGYKAPDESAVALTNSAHTVGTGTAQRNNGITLGLSQGGTPKGSAFILEGSRIDIEPVADTSNAYSISAEDMYTQNLEWGYGTDTDQTGFILYLEDNGNQDTSDQNNGADNRVKTTALDPVVKTKNDGAASSHFENGTLIVDTYDADTIDNLILNAKRDIDAMTYRGTINNATVFGYYYSRQTVDSIEYTVSIGDVFKAGIDFDISNPESRNFHAGDLIIFKSSAAGTTEDPLEDVDGKIPSGKIAYDVVASGNDFRYNGYINKANGNDNKEIIKVKETLLGNDNYNNNTSGTDILSFSIEAKNNLELLNSTAGTIEIGHSKKSYTNNSNEVVNGVKATTNTTTYDSTAQTVTAITSIVPDVYGHISEYNTQTFYVTDTHNDVSEVKSEYSVANNVLTNKVTVKTDDNTTGINSGTTSTAAKITSSTLTFTEDTSTSGRNANISIDLVWGSF